MTIEEALALISRTRECRVVWRQDTGEILAVLEPGIGQRFEYITYSCPFHSDKVIRATLEAKAEELARMRAGEAIRDRWAEESPARLIDRLERRAYEAPFDEYYGSLFLLDHLFDFHRRELRGDLRERLRSLGGTSILEEAAVQKLRCYLAVLDEDRQALAALWRQARTGSPWEDPKECLMKCLHHLPLEEEDVIDDLIGMVRRPGPLYGSRYQANLLLLGRIGPAAGPRAVEAIREAVSDSTPAWTATGERVCRRILTSEVDWAECKNCDHGLAPLDSPSTWICPTCLGIGLLPRDEAPADGTN